MTHMMLLPDNCKTSSEELLDVKRQHSAGSCRFGPRGRDNENDEVAP